MDLAPKSCLKNPDFSIQNKGVNLGGSNALNVFASSLYFYFFFPHRQKDFDFWHLNLPLVHHIYSRETIRMGENLKVPSSGRQRVSMKGTVTNCCPWRLMCNFSKEKTVNAGRGRNCCMRQGWSAPGSSRALHGSGRGWRADLQELRGSPVCFICSATAPIIS